MLRRGAEERGFHAYVRHLPLDSFPEVSQQLPITRALRLAGSRLQSVNLWIGDGGMRSNLHWDGHDNILLQLADDLGTQLAHLEIGTEEEGGQLRQVPGK